MSDKKTFLVTGGNGFIGSALVRYLIKTTDSVVVNLDKLTYAATKASTADCVSSPRYHFEFADICDKEKIPLIFKRYRPEIVIHLAAESHVDRSISDPLVFAKTNILGTMILLNAFKSIWQNDWSNKRFYHVSTDEVYGTLSKEGLFVETTPYNPNSPYSASKASSDHFVRSYGETYGIP